MPEAPNLHLWGREDGKTSKARLQQEDDKGKAKVKGEGQSEVVLGLASTSPGEGDRHKAATAGWPDRYRTWCRMWASRLMFCDSLDASDPR